MKPLQPGLGVEARQRTDSRTLRIVESSRTSSKAAGWEEDAKSTKPYWLTLRGHRWDPRPISWLRPAPLIESANQILDKTLSDVVNPRRQRWVAAQRAAGMDDFTFTVKQDEAAPFSFLLLGDPGEADESQYAVVKPLLVRATTRSSWSWSATAEEITITCFGATGRVIHENDPPVEDKLVVNLAGEVRSEPPG